jgi:hypothetical protein
MKGKQLAVVLILLVVLGGVALLLYSRNARAWRKAETATEGSVLKFELNDVAHVTIKGDGAEVNLAKGSDSWKVKERFGYPADFDKVAALIRKLWELHPAQEVKIGPSQLGRVQLTDPGKGNNNGILVDLKSSDEKQLTSLALGKKHLRESEQSFAPAGGIPAGRYVMAEDGSNRVFLVSQTFDEIQPKPEQWLDHDFVKVENPKSIAVASPTAAMNWKLIRETETAPWKLQDTKSGEELDNTKALSLAASLANSNFADVLDPKTPPSEMGLDKPSTIRIETFDHFDYELRIGKLMGGNYPIFIAVTAELPKERTPGKDEKPEDKASLDQQFQAKQKQLTEKLSKEKKLENWPFLMAKGTIDQILKDRSALLAEKKQSPSPSAPPGLKASATPVRSAPRNPPKEHP